MVRGAGGSSNNFRNNDFKSIPLEIHFILYRPARPGNVGAAARAMKTMGFHHLHLIDPCDHLAEEARMMAHGSAEILENARIYGTFGEVAREMELMVCTTAKQRSAKHDYHSSRDICSILEKKAELTHRAGILFGTEESGLPNSLVLQSDLAMTIPMAEAYPSLNLAQSVMVTAYELSPLNALRQPGEPREKSGEGWPELKKLAIRILADSGIREGTPLHHRIMERLALAGPTDIPLFLSVLSRLSKSY